MKEFRITKENEGQRFDKYLSRILSNASMSFIYKMLRKKNFVLNDKKADGKEILKINDNIKLYISDDTYDKFKTIIELEKLDVTKSKQSLFDISKNIVYEDKDIILINKPDGILSQKANKNDTSINEYLLDYLINNKKIVKDDLINYKPSVINRLDRNTTGLIIAAKNLKTATVLSKHLKDRTINKYYKCIVYGDFKSPGSYKAYLTKNNDSNIVSITKESISANSELIETEYDVINKESELSILRVHLITGKSHQIRAHLSYLGYPIIGDNKYGNKEINKKFKAKNQLLHAYRIEFPDFDEQYNFEFSGKIIECEPRFKY